MKLAQVFFIVILSAAVTVGTIYHVNPPHKGSQGSSPAAAETSYERVIRSQMLRCGYEYWDGAIMKSEKTGELYGPWVNILNALGTATALKIEWTSQVSWADVGAALKSGKIDAMCAGMWTSAAKAKEISFSTPLAYQAVEAFTRGDDHRFDDNLDLLNDPGITLAVIENDNSDFIAQQDFPKARKDSLGSLNGTDSELMMNVMTGKADATFTIAGLWHEFDKANSGKIHRVAPDKKLRTFGLSIAVDNDDPRLLEVINAGVQEIANSGVLDKILDRANQKWPDMYIKALKPYP